MDLWSTRFETQYSNETVKKKVFAILILSCAIVQMVSAQWHLTDEQKHEIESRPKMPSPIREEMLAMVTNVNHGSLAYRATVMNKMLDEANYFADKLWLPTKRPIQITDIVSEHVSPPWFDVIHHAYPSGKGFWHYGNWPSTIYTTNIYNSSISREARLRALKFGVEGVIETTNFEFTFRQGKLLEVMRLSEPDVEYLAQNLDKLVGQPSLIDTNGAYQLATQWLAAVNIDVATLENQFPHSVSQLRYQPRGSTNSVLLPLFFVALGTNNIEHLGNTPTTYDPAVEVEILGTTKELQDMAIARNVDDAPYDHRPLLLVTNALDLIRAKNPTSKQLENPATMKAFEVTPSQVSNYSKNFTN